MDENRDVEQMPATIGRYQVQASIGFGAMGAVYKAFDPLIKRTLAIKTIRLDIHKGSPQYKSFLERFYHEARISGTLSHPNIVTLFDIGEEHGIPFLAMEYVEGETIASIIEKGNKFDPERVIGLVSQVAAAIDYAHSRGVIHRDIKPSNLILSEGDRVKVTDFGIAKLVDAEMTQSGALLGTPSYMSPEQAMGDKLDGRSDIFSLGICAFEMLSGEQPFPGNNVTSILYKLVHVDPVEPPNLEMNGLVPQKWHEVFGRVLAKKPDERYQTANEFVQDLEYCLGAWFGSAVAEDAPATVIMTKAPSAPAAARPSEPTAAIPKIAPAAGVAEVPRSNTSPVPAMPPPRPAPAPVPVATAAAEEKTVVMRSPMAAPRPAAPPPPPPPSDEPATVVMKAPPPSADITARFPTASAAPSPLPAPRAPQPATMPPETAPVARPAPPNAASAPVAKSPSSPSPMGPLLIIGGIAIVLLLVGSVAVWKLFAGSGTGVAGAPTAAPTAPPTAPPTAVPTAMSPGIVHVESDPAGALIYLDGEAKGVTPTQLAGLPLGSHEVRLEMQGFDAKTQTIELTADAPETTVSVTLAAPVPTTGTADITSTPSGAAVRIGSKVVGQTPISGLELKAGTHTVSVGKEGYEPFSARMNVVAGRRARLEAPLRQIVVATQPPTPKPDVFDPNRVWDEADVDTPPKKTKGDSPSYPDKGPKLKSGDSVSVEVTWVVDEDGQTTDFKMLTSAGSKVVDDAVVETIRKQRYKPGVKKGKPVKVRLTRKFTFRAG